MCRGGRHPMTRYRVTTWDLLRVTLLAFAVAVGAALVILEVCLP